MRNEMAHVFAMSHCMKSVCIWSFSGPYFPAFGLNAEIIRVNLRIQSECGKIRTRKTPNSEIFHAVLPCELNCSHNTEV